MKISTRLRYGARLLVDLGSHYHEGPVFLGDVIERQKVSKKYLEQIIVALKAAGLIRAVRGPRGGYCLARDPKEVRMTEIYNVLEGPTTPIDCVEDSKACPYDLVDTCSTRDLWERLGKSIQGTLEEITLADLIRDWRKKV